MKHMSTNEVLTLISEASAELKSRFSLPESNGHLPKPERSFAAAVTSSPSPSPSAQTRAQPKGRGGGVPIKVNPQKRDLSLFQDPDKGTYFYSPCGILNHGCRYYIVETNKHSNDDMETRPRINTLALYVHGLDPKLDKRDAVETLERLIPGASHIKVVRTYAFIEFATHQAATTAQRVLWARGYNVSFHRFAQQPSSSRPSSSNGKGKEEDNDSEHDRNHDDANDNEDANDEHQPAE